MADQEQTERQIGIQKIYVKDFSFESPRTPEIFAKSDWSPTTNLNLRSTHSDAVDDNHEVVLTITVETKHEDTVLFLVELHQAGLFHIAGYPQEELEAVIGSFCPSVLYPYAREAIASVVAKGGFPEFLLQPINFDALYAQSKEQAAQKSETEPQTNGGGGNGAGGEA
jgi:preprotein translocase subunit SecB